MVNSCSWCINLLSLHIMINYYTHCIEAFTIKILDANFNIKFQLRVYSTRCHENNIKTISRVINEQLYENASNLASNPNLGLYIAKKNNSVVA